MRKKTPRTSARTSTIRHYLIQPSRWTRIILRWIRSLWVRRLASSQCRQQPTSASTTPSSSTRKPKMNLQKGAYLAAIYLWKTGQETFLSTWIQVTIWGKRTGPSKLYKTHQKCALRKQSKNRWTGLDRAIKIHMGPSAKARTTASHRTICRQDCALWLGIRCRRTSGPPFTSSPSTSAARTRSTSTSLATKTGKGFWVRKTSWKKIGKTIRSRSS